MEKNILLAIEKEEEYLYEKTQNNNTSVNIYDYLSQAGYDNLEEFEHDKKEYYKSLIPGKLKKLKITAVSDSADILQPMAYENYASGTPFCYFVEYDSNIALVPYQYTEDEMLKSHELSVFRCGNTSGGVIISQPEDFRVCICIKEGMREFETDYFSTRLYDFLLTYYPELSRDGNDFMYSGKKVAGAVQFSGNGLLAWAIQISLKDSYEIAKTCGIIKNKIPGALPEISGIKDLIKEEVQSWLQ